MGLPFDGSTVVSRSRGMQTFQTAVAANTSSCSAGAVRKPQSRQTRRHVRRFETFQTAVSVSNRSQTKRHHQLHKSHKPVELLVRHMLWRAVSVRKQLATFRGELFRPRNGSPHFVATRFARETRRHILWRPVSPAKRVATCVMFWPRRLRTPLQAVDAPRNGGRGASGFHLVGSSRRPGCS
jgi:hypothetical protein